MFIEIRKQGKKKKYYLVHSYRIGDKVKRISRYLGSDLNEKRLQELRKRAEELILAQIREKSVFEFELGRKEIGEYKKFDEEIELIHLNKKDWLKFTEDFTYNTNAIEGSTVAYSEVKELIENKEKPANTDEKETLGVAEAVNFIRKTKEKFSLDLIKNIHHLCFKDSKSFAGKFRKVEVVIRDGKGKIIHRGAHYKDVKRLLKRLVDWYDKHKKKYPPLLLSALAHNEFENIHPFQDGNGRVGRLLLNYVLLKHGYPPLNIRLKDRQRYYKVLQDYEKRGDIKSTLKFVISQYKK